MRTATFTSITMTIEHDPDYERAFDDWKTEVEEDLDNAENMPHDEAQLLPVKHIPIDYFIDYIFEDYRERNPIRRY